MHAPIWGDGIDLRRILLFFLTSNAQIGQITCLRAEMIFSTPNKQFNSVILSCGHSKTFVFVCTLVLSFAPDWRQQRR